MKQRRIIGTAKQAFAVVVVDESPLQCRYRCCYYYPPLLFVASTTVVATVAASTTTIASGDSSWQWRQ